MIMLNQNPFRTWWTARKYFRFPRIRLFLFEKMELPYKMLYRTSEDFEKAAIATALYKTTQVLKFIIRIMFVCAIFIFLPWWLNILFSIFYAGFIYNAFDVCKRAVTMECAQSNFIKEPYKLLEEPNGLIYSVRTSFIEENTKWYKPFIFDSRDVGYKTKWDKDDIRFETPPFLSLIIGTNNKNAWQVGFMLLSPKTKNPVKQSLNHNVEQDESYWEMMIAYKHAKENALQTAKKTKEGEWTSGEGENKKSYPDWDETFLKKKWRK